MRKCPRCQHDIKDEDQYCPYCGLDLEKHYGPLKSKKNKWMIYLFPAFIFFVFMIVPLLFSTVFDSLLSMGDMGQMFNPTVAGELPEKSNRQPQRIINQFDTLADFQKEYSNVSSIIDEIKDYEENIEGKANQVFNKEYTIQVLDNYDLAFQLRYDVQISENYELKIVKDYDREKNYNREKITLVKKNNHTFEELLFNDDELEYINRFINDEKKVNKIISDFSLREKEFEEKKETIGHYGMGEYQGNLSFVVERYGEAYESKFIYQSDLTK